MYCIEYNGKHLVVNTTNDVIIGVYDTFNEAMVICAGLNLRAYNASVEYNRINKIY